jgi:hypothetical protein
MKTRIGHLNYINNKNRKSSEAESYNFVWVKSDVTGEVFPIMLSHIELNNAIVRAKKNQEDIVERSFISKLID